MSRDTLREAVERGHVARRAGRLDDALAHYRDALAIAPDDAEANSLSGLVLLHLGKAADAELGLRNAVAREPTHIGFRLNLAEFCERQGQYEEAIRLLESIVADAPGFARAWERLGDLWEQRQKTLEAAACFARASALEPDNAALGIKWATAAHTLGRLNEARHALDRIAQRVPINEAMFGIYTDIFEALGEWRPLEAVAANWTRVNPSAARAWRAWSKAEWETGRLHQAMEHYRRALTHGGRDANSLATYGRLSLAALEFTEAETALNEAETLAPNSLHLLSGKALLLTMLGRFDEAEAYCRRCLAIDPDDVTSLKVLNQLKPGHLSDEEMANLSRLALQPDLRVEHRISAAYAAADCLHTRGRYDDAFAGYELANAIGRERGRAEKLLYNAAARIAEIDHLIRVFPVKAPRAHASNAPRPIFVVGMPRSGTTLIESVLAAHPQVLACGERAAMRTIMREFMATVRTSGVVQLPGGTSERWAKAYFADLPNLSGVAQITDKNPWNFDAIGLILRLFPDAKIIHTRRNPVETGLSIFCNEFSKFTTFANALEEIGHYYAQYARLMAHWDRIGDRLLTIQYEDFVADFDKAASALLAACGLSRAEANRDLLATGRPIATMSAIQVRRGLTVGEGRAVRYAARTTPLVKALEAGRVDLVTGALQA